VAFGVIDAGQSSQKYKGNRAPSANGKAISAVGWAGVGVSSGTLAPFHPISPPHETEPAIMVVGSPHREGCGLGRHSGATD
jgi:hypothetical protein